MEAKMKLLGHPIHQMLIVFPLGLLGMAVIFDVIALVFGSPKFAEIAFWMMGAGIVSGLIAAPFGTLDWLAIPKNTRAKRVGLVHGVGNVAVVVLFAVAWLARRDTPANPGGWSLVCSFVGFTLAMVTGWLGGELINRLGVGVDPQAHLDAPSSLDTLGTTRVSPSRKDRAA